MSAGRYVKASVMRVHCKCGGLGIGFADDYTFALTEDNRILFHLICGSCGKDFQASESLMELLVHCPPKDGGKTN